MKKLFTLLFALVVTHLAVGQCTPTFTYAPAPYGSSLLNVDFTNTTAFTPASGQTVTYQLYSPTTGWMYMYGSASIDFTAPGSYMVYMTMSLSDSLLGTTCSGVDSQLVTVAYPTCGTLVNATVVSSSTSADVIDFSSSTPSGATVTSYLWDFGDGTSSTLATPTHTYTGVGTYTATLTITAAGCTYTNSVNIASTVVDCALDSANFTIDASGYYYAINTPPNPYQMVNYSWDFGDGTTSVYGSGYHTYAASGIYTVTLTVNWVDSLSGTVQCSTTVSSGISIVVVPPVTNRISGNVFFPGTAPADSSVISSCKVWLIKYNPGTMILEAVDSTNIGVYNGAYYEFIDEPAGAYRVKVAVQYILPTVYGYAPTYHDSSLMWSSATVINHASGLDDNNCVYMLSGTVPTGSGFIGGNVTTGANKGTTSTVPAVGLLVYAVDAATNKAVQSVVTDASGNYSFSNLPYGTYYVHPELINYVTTNYTGITISAATPSMTTAGFKEHTISHTITPVPVGIASVSSGVTGVTVFPNPVQGKLNIGYNIMQAEEAAIVITDVSGKEVYNTIMNFKPGTVGTGSLAIDVSALADGLYILKVKSVSINYTNKVQIVH